MTGDVRYPVPQLYRTVSVCSGSLASCRGTSPVVPVPQLYRTDSVGSGSLASCRGTSPVIPVPYFPTFAGIVVSSVPDSSVMPTSSTSLMVPIRVRDGMMMLALLSDSFVLLHIAVALSLVDVCVCAA